MTFDTFKWENYIDELRADINFEDASGCTPYVLTSEDVESSNIYKRTLCILLCLLTKKGICQMEYKPSDYVAFLKDDLESIYQTNPEYVNCMLKFLASYNWTIPKGYYSEFDEEKDEYKDMDPEIEKMLEPRYGGALYFTMHNSKYDIVCEIYKYNKKNNNARMEYDEINSLVKCIAFASVEPYPYEERVVIIKEQNKTKNYFFTEFARELEGGWEAPVKDVLTMLSPRLLVQLPILDKMMNEYIKKWERKSKY